MPLKKPMSTQINGSINKCKIQRIQFLLTLEPYTVHLMTANFNLSIFFFRKWLSISIKKWNLCENYE